MVDRARIVLGISIILVAAWMPPSTGAKGAGKCFGKKVKEAGTAQGDRLNVGKGNDVVGAGGGNDRAKGGPGNDLLCGGGGKDRVNGGPGNDFLDGGPGKDRVNGGPGIDLCIGERLAGCESQPALHLFDGIDWSFTYDASGDSPMPGSVVTSTLMLANGIPGAAGYATAAVPPEGFLSGSATPFSFDDPDDGSEAVMLPFPVDFFGMRYATAFVSTNGYVSFGDSAWSYYFDDTSPPIDPDTLDAFPDYYRGVMPYLGDLDLSAESGNPMDPPGTVKLVTAADGSAFAIQWVSMAQYSGGSPERNFQVVFFSDGRIRFDYPGANPIGGESAFVGFSGGTGSGSLVPINVVTTSVPFSSQLFTPNPTDATATEPGTATTTIPHGTVGTPNPFASATSGCNEVIAATAASDGLVSCPVPGLADGEMTSLEVRWTVPEERLIDTRADYTAPVVVLADREQLDLP